MLENWPVTAPTEYADQPAQPRGLARLFDRSEKQAKEQPKIQLNTMEQYPMVTSPTRSLSTRTHITAARMQSFIQWLRNAQLAIGWAVMLLIVGGAASVYLYQVSQTALVGRNAELLDIELQDLRYSNSELRQQVAKEQSLTRMQSRTATYALQFTDSLPDQIEYLEVIVPPAPQPTPEPQPQRVPPPDTIGQAIRLLIYENVSLLGRGVSNGE